jgi:predicted ester cyclase
MMLLMERQPAELEAFYRRYLQRCNEHRFDELGEFVDENVEVNGLVDGCWLSAHLVDTGTTPTGRSIDIQEFAIYRVAGGRIIEVWGDLDRIRLGL